MKAFDYLQFDVQIVSAVPSDADAVLEWRECSVIAAIAGRNRDRDQALAPAEASRAQWLQYRLN